MSNDDPFRDWLVRRIAHFDDLAAGSGGTIEQRVQVRELATVLRCYDAEKAAAATDDAGTSNHADTAETTRTDDPDDQAAYEAEDYAYRTRVADVVRAYSGNLIAINEAVDAIAALPTPVKGGER